VIYPVFPPDKNAEEVLDYLRNLSGPAGEHTKENE